MEEVPLVWTPGQYNGYHALNFGWMIDELCLRTDARGRNVGQLLHDEAFAPLGISDAFVGLPDDPALEARVAWVEEPEEPLTVAAATGVGTSAEPIGADRVFRAQMTDDRHRATPELSIPWNRPAVHRAVVPGGGGISSARALAKMYAALALGGELDGVRIVKRESLEQAIVPTNAPGEIDKTIGQPMRWGTGWHIGSAAEGANMRTFGHGGRGGQMGWADLDRGLSFGFTTTGQLQAEPYQKWLLDLQSMAFRACKD
jgi:CubicO group peptidase (beta-lactamase class C family)